MAKVLSIILAGGEGKRLMPLTEDRAKPAVPFGGSYRLIDFAISNLVNAGYLHVAVLTQYKSHSLDRHISLTWRLAPVLGNYVTPVPAQQRRGPRWYQGSADAIYQSMNLINDERPGDDRRVRRRPRLSDGRLADGRRPCGIRRGRHRGGHPRLPQGVVGVRRDPDGGRREDDRGVPREADDPPGPARLTRRGARLDGQLRLRRRGPRRRARAGLPRTLPPGTTWAATSSRCWPARAGRWSTTSRTTRCRVPPTATATTGATSGPSTLPRGSPGPGLAEPIFNLYNTDWPIFTSHPQLPGAKFVHDASVRDTVVCPGSIVSGASVGSSVLGTHTSSGTAPA